MRYLADLHVHSRHSRATSVQCDLEGLAAHAARKGVRVVGTGDFTHPGWFRELSERLEPAEPGLCKIRENPAPASFMLTGEIACVYRREGRVRKVHSLVAVPSLDAAARVNACLSRVGNIHSDGRPILGLDPRNLLEILLEADPASVLIPAHIWTPWFSMLGSKSGFDSPLECFGDLLPHVFAVETGLSSDPPMNWRVPCLDPLALVSNSDLHSPQNLGRNANVFFGEPDYFRMFQGLRERDPAVCGGTLDLFPEEGKYHLDGHRGCGVALRPSESAALENLCPVCGKGLTIGVLNRVEELADPARGREPPAPKGALPFQPFIPLPELVGEILDAAPAGEKTARCCGSLIRHYGTEMQLLFDAPLDDVARNSKVPLLDEALRRMREGRVFKSGGYDGVYGEVKVFAKGERERLLGAINSVVPVGFAPVVPVAPPDPLD